MSLLLFHAVCLCFMPMSVMHVSLSLILSVPSWQPGFFLSSYFCLSYFCLSCSACHAQPVMLSLSCSACHVQPVMFSLSCSACHVQPVMFSLSCTGIYIHIRARKYESEKKGPRKCAGKSARFKAQKERKGASRKGSARESESARAKIKKARSQLCEIHIRTYY